MLFVGIDIGKNNHVASMLDETEKLYLKLSLFLIRRMAATLYFPSFSPILLIPPILILAWKLLVTTGFLFIPSSLRKDSFFMS